MSGHRGRSECLKIVHGQLAIAMISVSSEGATELIDLPSIRNGHSYGNCKATLLSDCFPGVMSRHLKLQKIMSEIEIQAYSAYFSLPSKKERDDAINTLMKVNSGFPVGIIFFIPYACIDDFKCYSLKNSWQVEWDSDFGIIRDKRGVFWYNNIVLKLVEKYNTKKCVFGAEDLVIHPVYLEF